MNEVKFKVGTSDEFNKLAYKDPLVLYFLLDTQEFYKGSVLMGTGRLENLKQDIAVEIYGGSAEIE